MRSKEEIAKHNLELAGINNQLALEVLIDIRDQLKRIGDAMEYAQGAERFSDESEVE